MDLKDLQACGAFVRPKLVKRDVKIKRPVLKPESEWADKDTPEITGDVVDDVVTVYIKRGSSADGFEVMTADRRDQPFIAIQRCICDEHGNPLFPTLEMASSLQLWLALPLFDAITKEGSSAPKASRRRTSSGAISHSPSADAASASGSTPSTSTKKTSGSSTAKNADP